MHKINSELEFLNRNLAPFLYTEFAPIPGQLTTKCLLNSTRVFEYILDRTKLQNHKKCCLRLYSN